MWDIGRISRFLDSGRDIWHIMSGSAGRFAANGSSMKREPGLPPARVVPNQQEFQMPSTDTLIACIANDIVQFETVVNNVKAKKTSKLEGDRR